MKKFVVFIGILLLNFGQVVGQNSRPAIITDIESTETVGDSKITIHQDGRIDKLMNDHIARVIKFTGPYSGAGYRVQVYSSNDHINAKGEALNIERQLRSAFPEQSVYRVFISPFWKVRIGDFRTLSEAQSFRAELIKAFPELRREIYTVRENNIRIQ